MNCSVKCDLDQGRHCECSHMATRRVFWLQDKPAEPIGYESAWLSQQDGGQTVDTEADDAPHPLWFYVLAVLALVALFGSPAFFF